jgi:hypothetical protein
MKKPSLQIPTEWASMLDTAKYTTCTKYDSTPVEICIVEGEVNRAGYSCIGFPASSYSDVLKDVARQINTQNDYFGKDVLVNNEVTGSSIMHYSNGQYKMLRYGRS